MSKPKAYVVFEPLNHLMLVVKAAKKMGMNIIVVRTLPMTAIEPYGRAIEDVDVDIVIDNWLEPDDIWDKLKPLDEKYDFVGSYAAAEITLHFNALFKEKYGLPGLAVEQVDYLLDKQKVRETLQQNHLTNLDIINQSSAESLKDWPVDKTFYFKPVNGAGSAQVKKCQSLDDLKEAISGWESKDEIVVDILRQYIETNNTFFLEEEAKGELLSVEGYVVDNKYYPIGLLSRSVLDRDNSIEMGSTFPYQHPLSSQIIDKVSKIHEVLNINDTPTHTEIIVTEDGDIELVELNIRFVGADILLLMNYALDAEIEDDIVRVTLGQKPTIDYSKQNSGFSSLQYMLAKPDTVQFDSIKFPEEAVFTRLLKPLSSTLKTSSFQMDHVGAFITQAENYDQVIEKSISLRRLTEVNGQPLGDNINNLVITR